MTERTLRDVLRERRARGAAFYGGRIVPDGQGGLQKIPNQRPEREPEEPRRIIDNDRGDVA